MHLYSVLEKFVIYIKVRHNGFCKILIIQILNILYLQIYTRQQYIILLQIFYIGVFL